MTGTLYRIFTAPTAGVELQEVPRAELVPGQGLVGDRYYCGAGTFSGRLQESGDFQLTLIEREEIDAFNADTGAAYGPGQFRRNVVTQSIRLNDLVGEEFSIGDCRLVGVRLCEPCAHLAGILDPRVLQRMVHRTGLRAHVLAGGTIRPGDLIHA